MILKEYIIRIDNSDQTDCIKQCDKTSDGYNIVYNSSNKMYSFGKNRVEILHIKQKIDCTNSRVFVDNAKLENVLEIHDYGKIKKIFFKSGKCHTSIDEKIHIEQNCLQNDRVAEKISYLTELAEEIGLSCDDGSSMLSKYYKSVDFISTDSVMSFYLSPRDELAKTPLPTPIIFPFGLNQSQKKAVFHALSSRISIIEGPPGTGKTQTILNIIVNLVLQGKTVAIAASNNSATDNILEKMAKNDFDFFCAPLGSGKNKDKFIANQSQNYPDISSWRVSGEEFVNLEVAITLLTAELDEMLEAQNQVAQIRQKSFELEQERKYFDRYLRLINTRPSSQKPKLNGTPEDILNLWLEYEKFAEKSRIPGLWFRIRKALFYGWDCIRFLNQTADRVIPKLQSFFYEIYKKELDDKRLYLEKKLEGYHFNDKMKEIGSKSIALFKAFVSEYYKIGEPRTLFLKNDLYRSPETFLKEYPVILSTTHSIRNSLSKNCIFDYIIIDEASQVDILTGALSLASAKNAIIVGDMMQLPNVITKEDIQRSKKIERKHNIESEYSYSKHSLLSSACSVWQKIPKTLLKEHYRCHPQIIGFCNKKFYNNQLVIMTEDNAEQDVLKLYYTRPGNHARQHLNQRQLDVIKNEIIPELATSDNSIGIITPYRAQANALTNQEQTSGLESDTVHKYQGREKENIIISTVDDKIGEFADNPNLLNVAVSRAIKRLRVVVSPDEVNENTNTGDLIKYIKRHNFDIVQSEISSIFDLLYKQYAQKRCELLKEHKLISKYDSENLANILIKKILTEKNFSKLDFTCHYPLSKLILNMDKLQERQRSYALHPATHVDFIIFNKMDKMPILAIEIDGTAYHREGSNQYVRDRMKDEILKKYDIPLIRLATNGSSEEKRVSSELNAILKKGKNLYEQHVLTEKYKNN